MPEAHYLFDWGDTLMVDLPGRSGPMCDWPEVRTVAGAAACLETISRTAACHLATNARDSDTAMIRAALRRGGIDHLLQRVFCYRQVGHMKPAPAYFEHIVAELGCPAGQITMVGDSLEMDVRGALQSGLQALWLNLHGAPVPGGIRAVRSLAELAALVAAGR